MNICEPGKYLSFTQRELTMSLWGSLACSARRYLEKNPISNNDVLECLIKKLLTPLENDSINDEHAKSIMALSAAWLGKTCPVDPSYQTTQAKSQSLFCTQLQSALPSLKIEQEKSINSLPPVDLLLPEHNIVVEVHGPFHYPGHDFKNTNGSTLLQRAGYDVIEIPENQLSNSDSVETYIAQIRQKAARISVDDCLLLSSPELQSETG